MKFKPGSKVKIKYPENVLEVVKQLSWDTRIASDFDVNKVYIVYSCGKFIGQEKSTINFGFTIGYELKENLQWTVPETWLVPVNVTTEEEKNKIRELLNKI